jgi:hypothetical protein
MLIWVTRRSTRKHYTAYSKNFFKITIQNAGKNRNTLWMIVLPQEGTTSEETFNKIGAVHIVFYLNRVKNFWTHLVSVRHIKETELRNKTPTPLSIISTYRGY